MDHLPPDFERDLMQVLEPRDVRAAAEIIKSASTLNDDGLRRFLELFAERVRTSPKLVTRAELHDFLRESQARGSDAP